MSYDNPKISQDDRNFRKNFCKSGCSPVYYCHNLCKVVNMRKVVIKILQSSAVTQTVLDGLTRPMYPNWPVQTWQQKSLKTVTKSIRFWQQMLPFVAGNRDFLSPFSATFVASVDRPLVANFLQ